ncbi:MAG: response regulator, partial [Alphaproteobacteria bacterium]|nr:response regulator [Alphaproteobacteria bacterium]
ARWLIGGPAAIGGAASFVLYGATGVVAAAILRRLGRSYLGPGGLVVLALAAVGAGMPAFFVGTPPAQGWAILQQAWYLLLIGNVLGILVLGLMMEELRHLIDERTRLAEARAAADAALRAKDRFISAVSHDIRTPLNGLIGMLQLIRRDGPPPAVAGRVDQALQAGGYLTALVDQVLDFARLEAGHAAPATTRFTLGGLRSELAAILAVQARDKGLSLDLAIDGDPDRPLDGPYEALRQTLVNLLGNAIKFTAAGDVRLEARVAADAVPPLLTVAVTDTGPGIDPADHDRVFEAFGRGRGAAGASGSGLGLAISRRLVAAMGGRLTLDSVPGQGATFRFAVPVRPADVAEEATPPAVAPGAESPAAETSAAGTPAEAPTTAPADAPALSVLVVDDNAINRRLLEEVLVTGGHRVVLAASGQEAIDRMTAAGGALDLVLMDIEMPDMSGVDAARAIRARLPDAADVPIVAVTANAFEEQRAAYLDAGMADVLSKPIDLAALDAVIARYGRRAGDAAGGIAPAAS